MLTIITSITVLLLSLGTGDSANILGIFTSAGPSHLIIHMATVKALADKGHNVTVVTHLSINERNPKYHHIHVPSAGEEQAKYNRIISETAGSASMLDSIKGLFAANLQRVRMHSDALRHPRFQELLNNRGNHFDLVILGYAFNTFQLGVAAHFKCPSLVTWVNDPTENILSMVGNPLAVSSVPSFYQKPSSIMDFRNRLTTFLMHGILMSIEGVFKYKMARYYDEHFPVGKYPSYDEVQKNISMLFCSTHFSEGLVRPMVPAYIEIGGIQIKDKPHLLPKDLHEFLKNADNGFILFSMGSNVKSTDLAVNSTLAIFKVLSSLKQKVIWKWDSKITPGRSTNIMFQKWFPQDDLLAHPKLRLFITHGGKGSVVEAQYHGVPMLVMPMYGDQFIISRRVKAMGYGLVVDQHAVTEVSFRKQLLEVLRNSSYRDMVRRFSTLYRDRPFSAKQNVVFWTEYVIRHHGARHIQSAAVHLNFFQKNSLDVIGFVGFLLFLGFVVLRGFIKAVWILMFRRKLKDE